MRTIFLVILTMLFYPFTDFCQSQKYEHVKHVQGSQVWTTGRLVPYNTANDVQDDDQVWKLDRALRKNSASGDKKTGSSLLKPTFILPIAPADTMNDPGFFTITAYFDHDSTYPDHLLDYNCGNLTYDLPDAYNHSGTDFFPWPFPWYRMAYNEIRVVAAAAGILYTKQDGNFDQNCETNSNPWNGVCILHEDGSTSWYLHMKANSLTSKEVGETIEQGEYLGIVGSSGSSTAPHLHFEVYNAGGDLIDPFEGPCNQAINGTWWSEQLPYKQPGINKISTNAHLPFFPDCPQEEIPNEKDQFYPGDTVYMLNYFRNLAPGDTVYLSIRKPDNSLFTSWLWISDETFQPASWLYFFTILQSNDYGQWKYRVKYKNKTYVHEFGLLNPQIVGEKTNPEFNIYPNPAKDQIFLKSENIPEFLVLYDLSGRVVKNFHLQPVNSGNSRIDLTGITPGAYLLRANQPGSSKPVKIFIR